MTTTDENLKEVLTRYGELRRAARAVIRRYNRDGFYDYETRRAINILRDCADSTLSFTQLER